MRMSVREARAQFAAAIAAAQRGERVTITKNGEAVAEIGPPAPQARLDWAALERFRRGKGWGVASGDAVWPPEFDDADFSRRALMLDDDPADDR